MGEATGLRSTNITGGRPKASCMAANATSSLRSAIILDDDSAEIDNVKQVANLDEPLVQTA